MEFLKYSTNTPMITPTNIANEVSKYIGKYILLPETVPSISGKLTITISSLANANKVHKVNKKIPKI